MRPEKILYEAEVTATGGRDGKASSTDGLLAVTQANLFSQLISGFTTNAAGPVSASLYEVIGNGQSNGGENLRFAGPCSELNLDNSLDGSTSSNAPGTCSAAFGGQCFWDDDVVDASSTFACAAGNGATSATLNNQPAAAAQPAIRGTGSAPGPGRLVSRHR